MQNYCFHKSFPTYGHVCYLKIMPIDFVTYILEDTSDTTKITFCMLEYLKINDICKSVNY